MLGVAASMAVARPATAGQSPTTAAPAKAPPPANQLSGASCPSANDCVAVGINANAADAGKGGGALEQHDLDEDVGPAAGQRQGRRRPHRGVVRRGQELRRGRLRRRRLQRRRPA